MKPCLSSFQVRRALAWMYCHGLAKMSTAACMAMKLRKPKNRNYLIVGMKCFSMPENGETVGMPFSDMQMEVTGKVAKNK